MDVDFLHVEMLSFLYFSCIFICASHSFVFWNLILVLSSVWSSPSPFELTSGLLFCPRVVDQQALLNVGTNAPFICINWDSGCALAPSFFVYSSSIMLPHWTCSGDSFSLIQSFNASSPCTWKNKNFGSIEMRHWTRILSMLENYSDNYLNCV